MIDLYYFPTPNTWKISIMLEECGLPYRLVVVNTDKDEQKRPEFLAINPNGRVPAIVDHDALGGPLAIFESGAILVHLAEKTGLFLPSDVRGRLRCCSGCSGRWADWDPCRAQFNHFNRVAPDTPYAKTRYRDELIRLWGVMESRLKDHDYLATDYSIADIACWGWISIYWLQQMTFDDFPGLKRWFDHVGERPGVKRGRAAGAELRPQLNPTSSTA